MKKLLTLLLAFACCACEEDSEKPGEKSVEPTLEFVADPVVTSESITFTLKAKDADECRYLCVEGEDAKADAARIFAEGTAAETDRQITLSGLKANTWYTVTAAARNKEKTGKLIRKSVRTLPGETSDAIVIKTVYEAAYFPDSDGDGIANYYLAFGDATVGPDDNLYSGYAFILDIYGAAAGKEADVKLPEGEYTVQIGGKGLNQIDMASSGVKQFGNTGKELLSNLLASGKIAVSYKDGLCIISGACTAGDDNTAYEFEYKGGLVFEQPENSEVKTTFTTVVSADYWGDVWNAGTANYEITLADDQNCILVLNMNDTKPVKDELRITPGTYLPDFDETGEAGHFIAGGTTPVGEPFGTFAIVGETGYLIDGGEITVAYDAATATYTFGVALESSGGLTLKGTYTGKLEIDGHSISTDKIDVVLTQSDDGSNYLYYDGADTDDYSQFTITLMSPDDTSPGYSFGFDLYCRNSAIDVANVTIPEGTYQFDYAYYESGENYTYEKGSTYDWTSLSYWTEMDDGTLYFKSGGIEVSRISDGYRIEANLVEEEDEIPVHLLYEGPISWDSSGIDTERLGKSGKPAQKAAIRPHAVRKAGPALRKATGPVKRITTIARPLGEHTAIRNRMSFR